MEFAQDKITQYERMRLPGSVEYTNIKVEYYTRFKELAELEVSFFRKNHQALIGALHDGGMAAQSFGQNYFVDRLVGALGIFAKVLAGELGSAPDQVPVVAAALNRSELELYKLAQNEAKKAGFW